MAATVTLYGKDTKLFYVFLGSNDVVRPHKHTLLRADNNILCNLGCILVNICTEENIVNKFDPTLTSLYSFLSDSVGLIGHLNISASFYQ